MLLSQPSCLNSSGWCIFVCMYETHLILLLWQPPGNYLSPNLGDLPQFFPPSVCSTWHCRSFLCLMASQHYLDFSYLLDLLFFFSFDGSFLSINANIPQGSIFVSFFKKTKQNKTKAFFEVYSHVCGIKYGLLATVFLSPHFKCSCCPQVPYR